jgi:hypothetical protein
MIHHPMVIVGREADRDRTIGTIGKPSGTAPTKIGLSEARRPFREYLRLPDRLIKLLPVAIDML